MKKCPLFGGHFFFKTKTEMLIAYTDERLSIRPKNLQAVFRIYDTGQFYLYLTLANRIGVTSVDSRVLLHHDTKSNVWYISRGTETSGLKLKRYSSKNYTFFSTELRKKMLESMLGLDISAFHGECFYCGASMKPSRQDPKTGHDMYELNLLK